jgi:hypothetical protein
MHVNGMYNLRYLIFGRLIQNSSATMQRAEPPPMVSIILKSE